MLECQNVVIARNQLRGRFLKCLHAFFFCIFLCAGLLWGKGEGEGDIFARLLSLLLLWFVVG